MNHLINRFSISPHFTALVLVAAGVLGLQAACSSDSNTEPSKPPPVISTGGGGTGGGGNGAGESSGGASAGKTNTAGGENGGSGGRVGGSAGEGGEAGATTDPYVACPVGGPTTDLGFLNRPSTAQKSPFDNDKRLGAHATLPALP